jgi:hypothetical protein
MVCSQLTALPGEKVSPMTESVPLGMMDRPVPSGSHVCAFYSGSAGRDEVVLLFLAEGLRTGHKCLAVLDSTSPGEVLAQLDERGARR